MNLIINNETKEEVNIEKYLEKVIREVLKLSLIHIFLTLVPIGLWITARSSGVPVSMGSLVAMRFRRINPSHIVYALIKSHQAGDVYKRQEYEGLRWI